LTKRIVIAGTGAITADIHETALLLGYSVSSLNPQKNSISVDGLVIDLADVSDEFRKLPVILSLNEYSESSNLSFDKKWVQNHKRLFEHTVSLGFKNWVSIIHPTAVVSQSAKIGKNVFINSNSTISTNSVISDNVFINRDVSIGHDVSIGSHSNIGPSVTITGSAIVHDSVFLGAGAIVINSISIGSGSSVAAGSVVIRDVEEGTLVMGSPARRKNNSYRKVRRGLISWLTKYLKVFGLFSLAKRIYSKLK
jgi:sugar O-acyltransferase (sialic acid O-acetyltransferase NeuD family)